MFSINFLLFKIFGLLYFYFLLKGFKYTHSFTNQIIISKIKYFKGFNNQIHGKSPYIKYRENTDIFSVVLMISLQRERRGKNTRKQMIAEDQPQTNHENQKKVLLKRSTLSSARKNKTEISNSFLKRIISLLKKEELI